MPSIESFVRVVPKVELHLHLVGSASPEVVADLAARHPDAGIPSDVDEVRRWYEFTDFAHFIEVYGLVSSLVRTGEDVARLVEGSAQDLAPQQVRYAEMTVTPCTQIRHGIPNEELVAGLEEGRRLARAIGVEFAWVYDIAGELGQEEAERTADLAVDAPPPGMVGFGLGGLEHGVDRSSFASVFQRARAAGLRSVPHAGEADGPHSIRAALDDLGADRIGHGVRAIEDPALLQRLVDERTPLEVCPSSNVCTGVVPTMDRHPLPALLDAGAFVTINTDDPAMFSTTLNDEYLRIADTFELGIAEVGQLVRNGVDASFLDQQRKSELLTEIDAVAVEHLS